MLLRCVQRGASGRLWATAMAVRSASGSGTKRGPTSFDAANRENALQNAIKQIEQAFGKGAITRMEGGAAVEGIDVVPSGSLGLDIALGVGGMPRGRVIEIFGPESSGKTTLALHVISQAQKMVCVIECVCVCD